MKRLLYALAATLFMCLPGFSSGIEPFTYHNLVAGISKVQAPVISGHYVIFTASGKARHTGIAFENENYRQTYSFQRKILKNEKSEKVDSLLFYIAEIPPGMNELRYRMVIDGLWTTDPLNTEITYDYANGMTVSSLPVEYYEIFQTQNVNKGHVRFTYRGNPGETITLAGNFNNWDPFMYEMTETRPGQYELNLPLPPGTWYYAYFEGTEQLPDNTNTERAYTTDGRIASVVKVN